MKIEKWQPKSIPDDLGYSEFIQEIEKQKRIIQAQDKLIKWYEEEAPGWTNFSPVKKELRKKIEEAKNK